MWLGNEVSYIVFYFFRFGDRILSVNGISLIGATHNEAVKALQLAGSKLKLVRSNLVVFPSLVRRKYLVICYE